MIATIHNAPIPVAAPYTPEWYDARSTGIGASEAAAACGLSDYDTPLSIWAMKRGQLPPKDETFRMRLGKAIEPFIKSEFCLATGKELADDNPPMARHGEYAYMLATPDGTFVDGDLLECKKPSWRVAQKLGEDGTDDVLNSWNIQCQQQMAVYRSDIVNVAVFVGDDEKIRHFVVERNDRLIRMMVEREGDLWDRIQSGREPDPDWAHKTTPDLIRALQRVEECKVIHLNPDQAALWEEQAALGKQASEIEKQREILKARFLHSIGDAEIALLPCGEKQVRRKLIEEKVISYVRGAYWDMRVVKAK